MRLVLRLMDGRKAAALSGWRAAASGLADRRAKIRSSLAVMSQRNLKAALNAWRQFAAESVRLQRVLQTVLPKLQHKSLAAAFTAWQEAVSRRASKKAVLLKAVAAMTQQL